MMKKEIIVKESNKEAITAAIKEAEGRATVPSAAPWHYFSGHSSRMYAQI